MKIAVVGCGGIGSVVSAILASQGRNVNCIELIEESVRVLQDQGIRLEGEMGIFHARVKAFTSLSRTREKFDVIIITVKNNVLERVFSEATNYLCAGGFIVTLQNGLEGLSIAERYPSVKLVAGAVGFNAIQLNYGECLVTSQGGITIGNLTRATADDLFLLKGILEPGISIDISKNIVGVLWAKLLIICGIAGLGGISGLLLGVLLKKKTARKLFYRIVTEGVRVARVHGVRIEKFGKSINPEKFGNGKGGYPLFLRWLLLKIVGLKYKNLRPGVQLDLENERKTEIDYLNGKIVVLGAETGIETPLNQRLVEMVKEIEGKKRKMSLDNLNELWDEISH